MSTFNLFLSLASVHSQSPSEPEPRLDDAMNLGSNIDGSTITVTLSSTYDVYCYRQGIQKDWYKINGGTDTMVPRNSAPGRNVYANRISPSGTETLALHFKPFRINDIGEYECRIASTSGQPSTTLSVHLSEYIFFMIARMHMYTDTNPLKSFKLQMYVRTKSLHFTTVRESVLYYCPIDGLQCLPN